MLRLANISKQLLDADRYGVIPVRYAEGTITLFVSHPTNLDLCAWSTRWSDPKKEELTIRTIECTIPKRMVGKSRLDSYLIGKDTYLLPEVIFNKLTAHWKNIDFN